MGTSGPPIRRGRNPVREQVAELVAEVLDPVGTRHLCGGDDRDDQAVGAIGAGVVDECRFHPEDSALVVRTDTHVVDLPSFVVGPDEVFAPVLGPLDGYAEVTRGPRNQHLLGVELDHLHSEPAADVGCHDVNVVGVKPEKKCESATHASGGLSRVVQQKRLVTLVVVGNDSPTFHRHRRGALHSEAPLEDVRGRRQRGVDVTLLLAHPAVDVVVHVRVSNRSSGLSRLLQIGNHRKLSRTPPEWRWRRPRLCSGRARPPSR